MGVVYEYQVFEFLFEAELVLLEANQEFKLHLQLLTQFVQKVHRKEKA